MAAAAACILTLVRRYIRLQRVVNKLSLAIPNSQTGMSNLYVIMDTYERRDVLHGGQVHHETQRRFVTLSRLPALCTCRQYVKIYCEYVYQFQHRHQIAKKLPCVLLLIIVVVGIRQGELVHHILYQRYWYCAPPRVQMLENVSNRLHNSGSSGMREFQ